MKDSTTEYVILGILSNKPRTGYDIHKLVKTRMGSFWDISYSQIYPTLRVLEKEGLVTKKVEINERSQNRKVYSITKEGVSKLQRWLKESAKPPTFKFEALLKIAFGNQASKEQTIKHLEELKAINTVQLENILSVEKEVKADLKGGERVFFALLTFALGENLLRTANEWVDSAIKLIEERE
jgi:PadR family transcriptional regulator, regulatory protein AphA